MAVRLTSYSLALVGLLCLCATFGKPVWAEQAGDDDAARRVWLSIKADPDPNRKLTYKWSQLAGPHVNIINANERRAYFVPVEAGEYSFQIEVSDGVATNKATINKIVKWEAVKPVAEPGANQRVTVGQAVVLSGDKSTCDPNRKITAWQWTQVDGPDVGLKETQKKQRELDFKVKVPGRYRFALKIYDGSEWSALAETEVEVVKAAAPLKIEVQEEGPDKPTIPPPPGPNVPQVGVNNQNAPKIKVVAGHALKPGEEIVLDGSNTTDPLGQDLEFLWRQKNDEKNPGPRLRALKPDLSTALRPGATLSCPVWRTTPNEPGTYVFVLTVSAGKGDDKRSADSAPITFEVRDDNTPPTAEIKPVRGQFVPGQTVTLDGGFSRDPDKGDLLEYKWGWSGEGERPLKFIVGDDPRICSFVAEKQGNYGIQLVVSDGKADSAPAKVLVEVGPPNQAPIVRFSQEVFTGVEDQVLSLQARVTDADGDPVKVTWSGVAPAGFTLPPGQLNENPLQFLEKRGQYTLRVTADDGRPGGVTTADVKVIISSELERPPTAVIHGPDRGMTGAKLTLTGDRSSDPGRKPLTYAWDQTAGPPIPGSKPDAKSKYWEFTPQESGKYEVTLTVSNGVLKDTKAFSLEIEQSNHPPVAAIKDPGELAAGALYEIDGSGSSDEDPGDQVRLRYLWKTDQLNGLEIVEGAQSSKVKIKANEAGDYNLTLVVNDGRSDSTPKIQLLHVKKQDLPPAAVIENSPARISLGQELVLDGTRSNDREGPIAGFEWSQLDNDAPKLALPADGWNKPELRARPEKPGKYGLQLIVTDSAGQKSTPVQRLIQVVEIMRLPVASAELEGFPPFKPNDKVTLKGGRSADPNNLPLTFIWRQTGGEPVVKMEPQGDTLSLVPPKPGEYTFELKVTNGKQESAPVLVSFKVLSEEQLLTQTNPITNNNDVPGVSAPPPPPEPPHNPVQVNPEVKPGKENLDLPVAVIAPIAACVPGGKITLDASASHRAGDAKGTKDLSYRWNIAAEPEGSKLSLGPIGRRSRVVEPTLKKPGVYVFELTVWDGKNWSAPVQATVKTKTGNMIPTAVAAAFAGFTDKDLQVEDLAALPYLYKGLSIIVEQGQEVLLDGYGSHDQDKGPNPLTYTWKKLSGAEPLMQRQDNARLRFTPSAKGKLVWELTVSDGEDNSQPVQVEVHVETAGGLPVASATAYAFAQGPEKSGNDIRLPAAIRGQPPTQGLLVLNGKAMNTAAGKTMLFNWTQVEGESLHLTPQTMNKNRVGLKIYQPGRFRFVLTVTDPDTKYQSPPSIVVVTVVEPPPEPPTTPSTGSTPAVAPTVAPAVAPTPAVPKGPQTNNRPGNQVAPVVPREVASALSALAENLEGNSRRPVAYERSEYQATPEPVAYTSPRRIAAPATVAAPHPHTATPVTPVSAPSSTRSAPAPTFTAPSPGATTAKAEVKAPAPKPVIGLNSGGAATVASPAPKIEVQPVKVSASPTAPALASKPAPENRISIEEDEVVPPVEHKPAPVAVAPAPVAAPAPESKPAVQASAVAVLTKPAPAAVPVITLEAAPEPGPKLLNPQAKDVTEIDLPPPTPPSNTKVTAASKPIRATTQKSADKNDGAKLAPGEKPWTQSSYRSEDPLFQRRKTQLLALANQGGERAEETLLRALDDRDADIRAIAAQVLGERGLSAAPALIKVLETNSSAQIQTGAQTALRSISGKSFATPAEWRHWWSELTALPAP